MTKFLSAGQRKIASASTTTAQNIDQLGPLLRPELTAEDAANSAQKAAIATLPQNPF